MLTIKRKLRAIATLGLVVVTLALTSSPWVVAQQTDDDKATQDEQSTEKKQDTKQQQTDDKQSDEKSTPAKPSGNFIPSEEISKDLSVSFPVDI